MVKQSLEININNNNFIIFVNDLLIGNNLINILVTFFQEMETKYYNLLRQRPVGSSADGDESRGTVNTLTAKHF